VKHVIGAVIAAGLLAGCSCGKDHVGLMLDHPPEILADSLYQETQSELDELERRYLNQEIPYAEYLEKKAEWEDYYQQQTDHRAEIIDGRLQESR